MRSIRVRISSAVSPASTANGSTGVCRKRDSFVMRGTLYLSGLGTWGPGLVARSCRLERVAEADVHCRAVADRVAAVVPPRGARGRGEGQRIAGDEVDRKLRAGRRLEIARVEGAGP